MDISFLGPAAASVIIVALFLRYLQQDTIQRQAQNKEFMRAIDANTKATNKMDSTMEETITYLKHRNGSFEKLIKEQPQIHKLVVDHFDNNEEAEQ